MYVAEPWGASSDGHRLFMCEDEFHGSAVTLHYMQSGVTCSTLSVCRLMFQRDFTCLQEDYNCRLIFQRDFTCLQEDDNCRLMFQRDFTCLQEDYNCRLIFQRDFTCLQEDENWRLMFHLLLELKIRLCFSPDFPPCLSSFDIFPPVFFYCHDSVQVPPPAVFLFFPDL